MLEEEGPDNVFGIREVITLYHLYGGTWNSIVVYAQVNHCELRGWNIGIIQMKLVS